MHETLNKLKVFARKVGDITTYNLPYVWHTNVWTGVKHLAFILSNNLPQGNNEMQNTMTISFVPFWMVKLVLTLHP